jgi:hypothetical protein
MNILTQATRIGIGLFLIGACAATSGCERTFFRDSDGSLGVTTQITQTELQTAITSGIADPLVKSVDVQLESGYMLVTGQRQRLNDPTKSDTLSFRLDLGVSGGHLTATVSNAQVDNVPVEAARVSLWNTTIANRLEDLARRSPNATLQAVTITPQAVSLTWQVAG